jgi:hypothetical protein
MPELYDNAWNKQYEQLVEFKRKHGNCLVPRRIQEYLSLGKWVAKQRGKHVNNKLRLDRKDLLDELRFVWKVDISESEKSTWKKQYENLAEFKRINGHCLVPQRHHEEVLSLGSWVGRQRQFHSNSKLPLDRKVLLDELGFVWKVDTSVRDELGSPWKKQYEKLVEFKRKNGHCLVKITRCPTADTKALGIWVSTQRKTHAKNKMRQDRKEQLDEIGFVWKGDVTWWHDRIWHQQYEKLVEFKRKNGNCLVPRTYKEDVSLEEWVLTQRKVHSNKKLRLDRMDLLDDIGFVWKAGTVAAHSSTTDVSCRWWFISSFIQVIFLTLVVFLLNLCIRIRIRKRPPAVWAFQTRH